MTKLAFLERSSPFWCFAPDLLHQLHKRVFKDHIIKWATECLEGGLREKEINDHFCMMPQGNNLWHFQKCISIISQWSGTEYKNMEKVFLGVLQNQVSYMLFALLSTSSTITIFSHTQWTLSRNSSLPRLCFTPISNTLLIRAFEKIVTTSISINYILSQYIESIISPGSVDEYSTKSPERLHIDFAKVAYWSTNKKIYKANNYKMAGVARELLLVCVLSQLICSRVQGRVDECSGGQGWWWQGGGGFWSPGKMMLNRLIILVTLLQRCLLMLTSWSLPLLPTIEPLIFFQTSCNFLNFLPIHLTQQRHPQQLQHSSIQVCYS